MNVDHWSNFIGVELKFRSNIGILIFLSLDLLVRDKKEALS